MEKQIAIITGAARGIGAAIAERLAHSGMDLALIDLHAETIATTAKICEKIGARVECFSCDVSNWDSVSQVVDEIANSFKKIDVLINNAGITKDNLILRMKPEDWDAVINVNLKGAFLMTKAVTRHMMRQNYGKIVNVSSVVGLFGNVSQANYSASKAGLIGLTKSTAKEFATKGIRANAVAPGFIETEMTKALPEKAREAFLAITPLKFAGTPQDVAEAVNFLSLPASDYITGEVLRVDGGMAM